MRTRTARRHRDGTISSQAVCRGMSEDGYRVLYRPKDVREDSVPGLWLPSGAPVFREVCTRVRAQSRRVSVAFWSWRQDVEGTIELVALHGRRADATIYGDWVHEGVSVPGLLEDLLRDREVRGPTR